MAFRRKRLKPPDANSSPSHLITSQPHFLCLTLLLLFFFPLLFFSTRNPLCCRFVLAPIFAALFLLVVAFAVYFSTAVCLFCRTDLLFIPSKD